MIHTKYFYLIFSFPVLSHTQPECLHVQVCQEVLIGWDKYWGVKIEDGFACGMIICFCLVSITTCQVMLYGFAA